MVKQLQVSRSEVYSISRGLYGSVSVFCADSRVVGDRITGNVKQTLNMGDPQWQVYTLCVNGQLYGLIPFACGAISEIRLKHNGLIFSQAFLCSSSKSGG